MIGRQGIVPCLLLWKKYLLRFTWQLCQVEIKNKKGEKTMKTEIEKLEELGIKLDEVNPFENEEPEQVTYYTLKEIEGE